MRLVLLLIPLMILAEERTGSIRGDARWDMKRSTRIVVLGSDGVTAQRSAPPNGGFQFENIRPGTYLLHVQPQGAGGRVQQIRVEAGRETFAGSVVNSCDEPENGLCDRIVVGERRQPEPVYTVCEALAMRDDLAHSPVVIVGILAQRPTLALSRDLRADAHYG